jgi:hypothetical protein
MKIRRAGFLAVAALFGLLLPAVSVSAGHPITQPLNPPPSSFYTCMTVGNGTICDGTAAGPYSQDADFACGSSSNAVELHDSGFFREHAIRYYDQDGNLTRRVIYTTFTFGEWSNPLTGAAVSYSQHNSLVDVLAVPGDFASATETQTGEANFTVPHLGAVFLNAGRTVIGAEGSVDFQAGPDGFLDYFVDGDTSVVQQLCGALGVTT